MASKYASGNQVDLLGWKQARRELKKLDDALPAEAKQITLDAAQEVVDEAKAEADSQGGVAKKSADSLKAFGQVGRSYIRYGGKPWPYAMGAEFGSVRYKQFKPWKGNGDSAGWFLYPTIRKHQRRIAEQALQRIEDLINRTIYGQAA